MTTPILATARPAFILSRTMREQLDQITRSKMTTIIFHPETDADNLGDLSAWTPKQIETALDDYNALASKRLAQYCKRNGYSFETAPGNGIDSYSIAGEGSDYLDPADVDAVLGEAFEKFCN